MPVCPEGHLHEGYCPCCRQNQDLTQSWMRVLLLVHMFKEKQLKAWHDQRSEAFLNEGGRLKGAGAAAWNAGNET